MQKRKSVPDTVGELLSHLLPRLAKDVTSPIWPPDVFACCMTLLLASGAYCGVLENWPPKDTEESSWAKQTEGIAVDWRMKWTKGEVPSRVAAHWNTIIQSVDVKISELCNKTTLCQALLELSAITDEACADMGVPHGKTPVNDRFYDHADDLLEPDDLGSTLCEEIDPARIRVLPKMRTPQNGLTIRSLSHHLGLCPQSEVRPQWVTVPSYSPDQLGLNLLIVPWPLHIDPSQFCPTPPLESELRNMPENFGFFTFAQKDDESEVVRVVDELYEAGKEKLGQAHGVILPEIAISPNAHAALSSCILQKGAFLITGVGAPSEPGKKHGTNLVQIDIPGMQLLTQRKHHRWKLDGAQIAQYGLGGRLHPGRNWWEHIALGDRQLLFVSMLEWLVMCPLICEDLARPDPIGDVIRAVGPNLIIALLMDGPQIKERWGARYATALADDPGSSVLVVTSIGMSTLTRPFAGREDRSRVVALWKDPQSGIPREIEIPDGSDGIMISLSARYLEEWTADGRTDGANAGCPMLSGVHPIKLTHGRTKLLELRP